MPITNRCYMTINPQKASNKAPFEFKIYFFTIYRELQRIESITNSPILAHFSETMQGVTTIRAYNQESRFMEMIFKKMEANNVAFILLNSCNRWLGIALVNGILVSILFIDPI